LTGETDIHGGQLQCQFFSPQF